MNLHERLRRAQYVLSFIPYSPCGVTGDLIRCDLGIPVAALQEPMEHLIEDIRTLLRVVICEEPVEVRGKPGHNEPEYWVAPGKLNRRRATDICATVLAREDAPNFEPPKLYDVDPLDKA